jgi:hypothetical protein
MKGDLPDIDLFLSKPMTAESLKDLLNCRGGRAPKLVVDPGEQSSKLR